MGRDNMVVSFRESGDSLPVERSRETSLSVGCPIDVFLKEDRPDGRRSETDNWRS